MGLVGVRGFAVMTNSSANSERKWQVPMLAAQGMKAVANLFQPDSRETLARPEPMKPAAPEAESGYPKEKRDGRSAAGSRVLVS